MDKAWQLAIEDIGIDAASVAEQANPNSGDREARDRIISLDLQLERHFAKKFVTASFLSRKVVSFQANKTKPEYRWFKYKEGFSADLVDYLLTQYEKSFRGKVLDPFAGAGTTLFTCNALGIDADGIELLPIGHSIIETRQLIGDRFSSKEFSRLEFWQKEKPWNSHNSRKSLTELRITEGAYSAQTKASIERFLYSLENESEEVRTVLQFALLCILESVSFTRKDGQYLRWDYRANRKQGSDNFNKREILEFDAAICKQIEQILQDTLYRNKGLLFNLPQKSAAIQLLKGSCLEILPTLEPASYDCIITSPPYCNRYDYTRTYALELALLGITEAEIVWLRQAMLSCTVENREKEMVKTNSFWHSAIEAADKQDLLQAILSFLNRELESKRLNNNGIPRMVKGYFYEMACVIAECQRLLKPGAPMFVVNDNVRYAGVQVSVDTILSNIAESLGFEVEAILVMPSGKGNSSQQMGAHGRTPVRKSVYVWRKK